MSEATTKEGGEQPCESCGDTAADLVTVQRVYVTPESWENEPSAEIADTERWCRTCTAHYPHVPTTPT